MKGFGKTMALPVQPQKRRAAPRTAPRTALPSVLRKEGMAKITGAATYIDDIGCAQFPDLWHGTTVRSRISKGRIREIRFDPTIAWSEFCIVTAKNIPGKNIVALIESDQPYLADTCVNHAEEPIVLIAHPDKHQLERARRGVAIEYETNDYRSSSTTLDFERSNEEIKSFLVNRGDVDSVWSTASVTIVEGEYRTGAQEQLYIEPNGVIAKVSGDDITVWGSMQCPYYVHKALKSLFNKSDSQIRVIQTETGGGFGGKEEYPSILAGHAALLAWHSKHPVKMIYDRAEDLVATTKRHPSRTRHKTAVTPNGKLIAMGIDFLLDGGAYATLSAVVLSRGTIHAAGPYACANVRIRSRVVKTNTPPHGAFRGFGAPQSLFALELHMDKVALAVGLSPDEFRRRNFLKQGDATATGQIIRQRLDLDAILNKALTESCWKKKRAQFKKSNNRGTIKKGIGMAAFMHGAGFTGSGEKYLASKVAVEGLEDGRIAVLTANTEIGQGTNTIFSQVVSETLGVDYDSVVVAQPDTGRVPNSGPTVASRTCMIVGKLVENAALDLKRQLVEAKLLPPSGTGAAVTRAISRFRKSRGELKGIAEYVQPAEIQWDDLHYKGDAYGAFAWAVYVAEVSVDTVTYAVSVDEFVAVQEVGRVVHPLLAEGQIVGGVVQGIGWALYENVVWSEGRMANNSLTNYIIPTFADTPPVRVCFLEEPYAGGPGGAKGIGELPLDGPAPAILNAIENALGVPFNRIPLLPEEIMSRMCEKATSGVVGERGVSRARGVLGSP